MVLNASDGLELVGEAEDGAHALRLLAELRPDVLIIDNHMPGMTGVEAIRRIRSDGNPLEIIMFSSDPTVEGESLRSGADTFFLKGDVGPVDLLDFLLGAPTPRNPGTVGHAVARALGRSRPSDVDPPR
ncbi:MAG: hypothetical protein NVS3B12_27590 [Acidimicrobiales bacterium]